MNLSAYFKILKVYTYYKIKRYVPFSVYLAVTSKCFLKCKHCYIPKKECLIEERLSTQKIYSLIEDAKKIGIPYFNLWGGEPLLRKDIINIGKKLKKEGIISTMTTNGHLITEKKAEEINNTFDIVKVSFKGLEKTHDDITSIKGSYSKTLTGLENLISLKKRKCQVIINFTVNKKNYKEIEQFVKTHSKNTDLISFLPENRIIKTGVFFNKRFVNLWLGLAKKYSIADFKTFITHISMDNKNCDAGRLYFAVYPSGDVYPCDVRREIKLGNINQERFYDIWKRGLNEGITKKIKKCQGCYMKSTKEVSQVFRMSPLRLMINIPALVKTYKLR